MIRLKPEVRVYLASSPIDGRKAINGLSASVVESFNGKLMDGSVFVFYNHARNRIKCLFWDRNGFVLYHKRLERGKFHVKASTDGHMELTQQQLDWLLAGLDFSLMSSFPELNYEHIF
ncbi:MAG: transposase [Gammaproteobacteria bacterium]|nr:transposase [Chitinophagia bacterium]NDH09792.1 transposase [Gammaproteobacteria bacterium]